MTDIPFHLRDEAGAVYTLDVLLDRRDPEDSHYDVDLVRTRVGRFGEPIEQRLTLAEAAEQIDAEAQRQSLEDRLAEHGLDGLGDATRQIRQAPVMVDGVYLFAAYPPGAGPDEPQALNLLHLDADGLQVQRLESGLQAERDGLREEHESPFFERVLLPEPLDGEPIGPLPFTERGETEVYDAHGEHWPAHVDGGSTRHWFAIVETADEATPFELRYFRALEDPDSAFRHDSYPVMPLPDDQAESAWPLPGLAMYLAKGDVFMAQQFAHDVADTFDQPFPEPDSLPALDPRPDYYFGYGIGPNGHPALEAVKTWMDGSERCFDTFTVAEYGSYEEIRADEFELEDVMMDHGLEAAMHLAERMAVAGGYLDPNREDGRVFFNDDAPEDPFATVRQTLFAPPPPPEYFVQALSANGIDHLDAVKSWEGGYERLVIPQPDWETARQHGETAFALLREGELEAAMHGVEREAVARGVLDPDRDDPRLFTQGPPDPFTTLRERERLAGPDREDPAPDVATAGHEPPDYQASLARTLADEPNPYWNLDDGPAAPAPEPGSWDDLLAQQAAREEVIPEPHYWQVHYRPVETPDGQPLGTALFITEFPQLPPEFDRTVEAEGIDDSQYPTEARTIEMAHFAHEQDARKFEAEFRSYLVPGILDGPELAPEVAKLEGLSGEWQPMDYAAITGYMRGERTIVRAANDWHLHNPNAERDARIGSEVLYTDPMQQFTNIGESGIDM